MKLTILGSALSIAALAGAALAADTVTPQPVVDAERAFQKSVTELGFRNGFLAHVSDDAIIFKPGPVNAQESLTGQPDDGSGKDLEWWPLYAGISTGGDFGFTTGGVNAPIQYITVWQKQADGSWKWIYDGGPGQLEASSTTAATPVDFVPPASASAGSAEAAMQELAPLEEEIASGSASDVAAAHAQYLADDGRVIGSGYPPSIGPSEREAEFARWPKTQIVKAQGGAAAPAGDMAYTYGEVRYEKDGEKRWGHYVHIWQKRTEGWRLVLDAVIRAQGEPPA